MTEEEVLNNTLGCPNDGYYCSFVDLGHVHILHLIDARPFPRGTTTVGQIAVERAGYNPRAGAIVLDITIMVTA